MNWDCAAKAFREVQTKMQFRSSDNVSPSVSGQDTLGETHISRVEMAATNNVASSSPTDPMSLRLRVLHDDDASPSHKRVRLTLSVTAAAYGVPQQGASSATAVQSATPDLFDATPGEATGVAPGRRKSSRSRVYSQRSSGGCK